ncbi:MAG: hypothetical protein LBK93_04615 [Rickettsiales bacterium]|nr:hypothetical protein [Rickettsiales bacterium]
MVIGQIKDTVLPVNNGVIPAPPFFVIPASPSPVVPGPLLVIPARDAGI